MLKLDDYDIENGQADDEKSLIAAKSYLSSIINRLMHQDGHELILPSRISLASFTEINSLSDVSKCSNEIDDTLKVYYSNPFYQGIMLYPHHFHECKLTLTVRV